jgi:hypothetical protein
MQNAETVLSVLRERGRRGLPLNELYRQLFNPSLYLLAIGRLYSNHGAMTPGVDGETVDGTSPVLIGRIIDAVRHERYRFRPARRVHIPKKGKTGKTRPLGLPTWSDKIVGEVVRLLLEAYYEPRFSEHSHAYRPRRSCHTALGEVTRTWTGTTWFIEGDIADCFGSLDHEVMLSTLAVHIHDNRFLRLLRNTLEAGYLEDWVWNATLSGAPQGGVTHPSSRTSTWTGWTDTSKQHSSRNALEVQHGPRTRHTEGPNQRCAVPGNAVTVPPHGNCASSCTARPAGTFKTPATGGCATHATPTTSCSGSPDPKPKPRKSKPD